MMKKLNHILIFVIVIFMLSSCSPVKVTVSNQYQLSAYSVRHYVRTPGHASLLVTAPEAVAGYQTEQMLYMEKPFQLEAFAKNAWVSPPGDMLYPLMVQSLQQTGFFNAVTSNSYSQGTDYRLDTQLLSLKQNFLVKPSVMEFSVKVVLTHIEDNRVLASRIISQRVPCPSDTPYGGVVAANRATEQFTAQLARFIISQVRTGN